MFNLTGKTALVTGATGGIGLSIAKALHAQGATVALSGRRVEQLEALKAELGVLRRFLFERMYRHYRVNRTRSQARRMLGQLFQLFMEEPEVMPPEWGDPARTEDRDARARAICDYIAGMTDRYAIEQCARIYGKAPEGLRNV